MSVATTLKRGVAAATDATRVSWKSASTGRPRGALATARGVGEVARRTVLTCRLRRILASARTVVLSGILRHAAQFHFGSRTAELPSPKRALRPPPPPSRSKTTLRRARRLGVGGIDAQPRFARSADSISLMLSTSTCPARLRADQALARAQRRGRGIPPRETLAMGSSQEARAAVVVWIMASGSPDHVSGA